MNTNEICHALDMRSRVFLLFAVKEMAIDTFDTFTMSIELEIDFPLTQAT